MIETNKYHISFYIWINCIKERKDGLKVGRGERCLYDQRNIKRT